jgi:hypothetical protein
METVTNLIAQAPIAFVGVGALLTAYAAAMVTK